MRHESGDLVVIGGGIQGAMVALEAAQRGLRPILIERGGFGAATSANSLGIVHGGLRYLQHLDIARHQRSAAERNRLLCEYPGQIAPLACVMPLYDRGLECRWVFRAALALHDRLARRVGPCPLPASTVIDAAAVERLFPAVPRRGLVGGALWHEGTLGDASSFVTEVLNRARRLGAITLDHVEAQGLLDRRGRLDGVAARETGSHAALTIEAPVVINCAGPWAGRLARRLDPATPPLFEPILGCNLVLDRPPVSSAAVALKGRLGRALFLRPWQGRMVVGTAYRLWSEAPDRPQAPEDLVDGLLRDLAGVAPELAVSEHQVCQVQAGLLPSAGPGSDVLARHDLVFDHGRGGSRPGLFTVAGVKLTTARALAARVLARSHPGKTYQPGETVA